MAKTKRQLEKGKLKMVEVRYGAGGVPYKGRGATEAKEETPEEIKPEVTPEPVPVKGLDVEIIEGPEVETPVIGAVPDTVGLG